MFFSVFIRLTWAASLLCAAFAMLDFVTGWSVQQGAPQQAALAAYTMAWAVIPYCLARAFASVVGKSQA